MRPNCLGSHITLALPAVLADAGALWTFGRVWCPLCGKIVHLTKTGKLHTHRPRPSA